MKLKRFGGVKLALLSAIGVAAVGYGGYKVFFNRTGEAAVALIPSDATFVVTLDTNPSTQQLPTFQKIVKALNEEGFDKDMEDGMGSLVGKAGLAKEMRQYVSTSFALAFWSPTGGKSHGLALFSLKDKNGAEAALKTGKSVTGANVPAYRFESQDMVISVMGNYLAVASDVETLNRADATQKGAASIASLDEYRSARAALPEDSTVMCFISPSAIAEMAKSNPAAQFVTAKWMGMSATVRSDGLQLDFRGPVDNATLKGVGQLAPLSPTLLSRLPGGAFGVLAYSQPAKYYSMFKNAANKASESDEMNKQTKAFEQETGISIEGDIVPALNGDIAIAAYPDASNNPSSADFVALITNDNNATPANLVEKLQAVFEKEVAKQAAEHPDKKVPHLVQKDMGGAKVWSLDPESLAEMQKSMEKDSNPALRNKNILIAAKDGNVFVCTSDAMLAKTLAPSQSLSDDSAFSEMAAKAGQDPQGMVLVAVGRVIEAYRSMIDKASETSHFKADDLLALTGGPNSGLLMSGKMDREVGTATFFLPLDWEKAIHMVGTQKREGSKPRDIPTIPSEPSDSTLQIR